MKTQLEEIRIKEAVQKAYPREQIVKAGVVIPDRMIYGIGPKCGFNEGLYPVFIAERVMLQNRKYVYSSRLDLNKTFPHTPAGLDMIKKYIRYLAETGGTK